MAFTVKFFEFRNFKLTLGILGTPGNAIYFENEFTPIEFTKIGI